MAVSDEVRDPWSWVVAGFAGGMAAALSLTAPVAVGIGAAVFGIKVVTGALTRSGPPKRKKSKDRRLPVLTRTPEAAWLARAQQAQVVLDDIADSAREGPVASLVQTFGDETNEALGALQRVAGQASAVRSGMARLDTRRLAWERDRILGQQRGVSDPAMLAERDRALKAVEGQMDAYRRLDATLAMLLAKLESGTLAVEGLVARMAEVVALAETSSTASDGVHQLEVLAHELEGLRAGLVEAEAVSTRAMQGLPPLPTPAPGTVPTNEQEPSQVRRRAGE